MRYKCLVLDHDDTTVNSTPCIHYPAFVRILEELRPGVQLTQEEFLTVNLTPGLLTFYKKELGFTPEEMARERDIWRGYLDNIIPPFFPELSGLIRRQKEEGGFVCVVSHSFSEYIRRDYNAAGLPEPDMVFGVELEREKNKPNPWPLEEMMRVFGCDTDDLLVVDDLNAGLEMAHSCGVKFAAAGWGYENPCIHDFMKKNADYFLEDIKSLTALQFSGDVR